MIADGQGPLWIGVEDGAAVALRFAATPVGRGCFDGETLLPDSHYRVWGGN